MLGGNPAFMSKMVEKGILGRKVGKGFYLYPKDAKKGSKEKALNPEVRNTSSSSSSSTSFSSTFSSFSSFFFLPSFLLLLFLLPCHIITVFIVC